ncbi:MAG: DNA polymerase III subunit beta [Nitrospiraceae bacterium]|nr:DNA polymerase III subunit beta [Nitrospiraceae bacterium]
MQITISRQDLLDTVNKVKTVVSAKSALPILSHILMEARESSLKLSATDLKVSIECEVDCTVEQPGSLTVSSQRLAGILSELPNEDITLKLGDNNIIELSCGRINTKLFSMAPEEFPPIRAFEGVEPLVLPQPMLKTMFDKTSFAICTDQARYNLTGLLFELADGHLSVVATDGRRMSFATESEGIPEGINVKVVIPGKMIYELERLLGADGEIQVFIDEVQAAFSFGSTRLVTALIEGNFPNYDVVIPKKHDKEGVLKTMTFMEAVRRTRTMTNDKFNSVRFILDNGVLGLKVVTPEVGEYEEELEVEYEGEKVEIAFNPDFLLDILRHVSSEMVCLILKDSMSPGVVKPFSEAPVDSYVNVVMPIRL